MTEEEKPIDITEFGLKRHTKSAILKALMKWSENESSINLIGFCSEFKVAPITIETHASRDPAFEEVVDLCKSIIGARRERQVCARKIPLRVYELGIGIYDAFYKQEKRSQMTFEEELRRKNEVIISDKVEESFNDVMGQLRQLQGERNICEISSKAAVKS